MSNNETSMPLVDGTYLIFTAPPGITSLMIGVGAMMGHVLYISPKGITSVFPGRSTPKLTGQSVSFFDTYPMIPRRFLNSFLYTSITCPALSSIMFTVILRVVLRLRGVPTSDSALVTIEVEHFTGVLLTVTFVVE